MDGMKQNKETEKIGGCMDIESFLLEMAESEACQRIAYKRLSIGMSIGLYYSMEKGDIDPFMIPFRDYIKDQIRVKSIDVDDLIKYILENDKGSCFFLAITRFKRKKELSDVKFISLVELNKIITPFVDEVDMDVISLIVVSFVFDHLFNSKIDIREIVEKEEFIYPTNQYNLTKVNGAIFKRDGLIYDGKGYFYNIFTEKSMLDQYDKTVGFAKIIHDEAERCDILYRIDERLSMPASEFHDYTGVAFAKYRGPQFNFQRNHLDGEKTIVVHYDEKTLDKLLMVIKQREDQNTNEPFWHIEIETLPYMSEAGEYVITTFLHGMYYPERDVFTHIDYTKNQYNGDVYLQKYADSENGMSIDQYTETRDLHYKIWCIENGEFSRETWYKLMIISLSETYQRLLNEMLA